MGVNLGSDRDLATDSRTARFLVDVTAKLANQHK